MSKKKGQLFRSKKEIVPLLGWINTKIIGFNVWLENASCFQYRRLISIFK